MLLVNGLDNEGTSYINRNKTDNNVKKKFKRSTKFRTAYGQEIIFDIDKTSHDLFGTDTPVYLAKSNGQQVAYERYIIVCKTNFYSAKIYSINFF